MERVEERDRELRGRIKREFGEWIQVEVGEGDYN
jgi:hypothetical protein